jgi:hypothetical protein
VNPDLAEAGLVVPGEVRVRLDEAGHQGGAAPVNRDDARGGQGPGPARDPGDAVALDENLARIRQGAGPVEDPDVREQNAGHCRLLPESGAASGRVLRGAGQLRLL